MKIERIHIYHVAMPLVTPFNTAFGDTYTIESVLVRMESEGIAGWGEAAPWGLPLYSSEWAGGVFDLARRWLGPRLLGQEVASGEELRGLLAPLKGNYFAKSAFDLAWWDWKAQREGMPLWQLLGGSAGTVDVGADFGVMDTVDELLHAIEGAVAAGFPRIKLKMRPGWDGDVMRRVREAFPDAVFHVDANSGYRLEDADLFRDLDDLNLAMIEQPLAHDDLLDHAKLAAMIRTPICLDESITSPARAAQAIEIGACGFINIKPGRVGGLTNAMEILEVARERGVPCWIGGMLESAVGASHCLALATLPGMGYGSDVFPTSRFYEQDLADQDIALSSPGKISAFVGPGIGCAPDAGRLAALTVQHGEVVG